MKRKLLILFMSAAMAVTVQPVADMGLREAAAAVDDDEQWDEETDDIEDDEDDGFAGELTKYDLRTSPAKKTIKAGKSFYIQVIPEDNTEFEDLPDEEWEELCNENIDGITFRSTNSSVASVNKKTGYVKTRRKGVAVIKTQINLANGDTATYKTKVYVTR